MSDRDPSARFARALMTAAVRPKREFAMNIYVVESDTHRALIVAESAHEAVQRAIDAHLVQPRETAATVARLGACDPDIGAALGTAILVVEKLARDFWPLRGAREGLHLPDRDGINVGRNGRTLGPVVRS